MLLLPLSKRKENNVGKVLKWGTIAFGVYTIIHFLPDMRRYIKMERM